ncbi:MAG: cytochrome c nitrite reductase small subunit [Planctomycetes bacterium]|nr:cytochrome c nitrite reductase small subunit [Planctomycetota bacterium]
MARPRRSHVFIAALVGAVVGLGLFTFGYARGLSYMSNDPRACTNCHVMNDQFASWSKSTHHHVAVCNDCHVPHDFVGKYLAKARNGWNHSKAFTLQDFPEPIRITPHNAAILQTNCVRCHEPMVHDTVLGAVSGAQSLDCVHCHQGVGHGAPR